MELTLAQLAIHLNATLIGGHGDTPVVGITGLDSVAEGEVTFILQERQLAEAEDTQALALIVPVGIIHSSKPLLVVENPRSAFGRALSLYDWRRSPIPGIDTTARIAQTAAIHARAYIGPFTYIGEGAVIGENCVIHSHVSIGDQVEIGAGSVIYPHVTIYPRITIGRDVIIHASAVIGADGHGYQPGSEGWEKIPHLGTVQIGDAVEIGACTTIDRATTGVTMIGAGSKVDNLVMVAHNVHIGNHCMIVGQAGLSGSVQLDDFVVVGGQVGLRDKIHIGAGTRIAGQSGVTKDLPPGITVSGYPAQEHREELRLEAALRRVPELLTTVKQLEQQIAEIKAQLGNDHVSSLKA